MDLEINMERMWFYFCKSGFLAADRARVCRLQLQRSVLHTHVLTFLRNASARPEAHHQVCSSLEAKSRHFAAAVS
jgi:hypothetical protein